MKVPTIVAFGLALTWLAVPAFAQPSNDYCLGKSLTLVVGSPPAGGYDTYGRVWLPSISGSLFQDAAPSLCRICRAQAAYGRRTSYSNKRPATA
jgi:hypothetical protein